MVTWNEFSLAVRYRRPERGTWPRPTVAGFRLDAGYSNEGGRQMIADGLLLDDDQLARIGVAVEAIVGASGMKSPGLAAAMADIGRQERTNRRERLAALRLHKIELSEKIAQLEAMEQRG